METNVDQLTNDAAEQLETVKGLKRLDKLFGLKPGKVVGVRFNLSGKGRNELINHLDLLQKNQIDLAVVNLINYSEGDLESFFEEMRNFRREIYMPLVINIDRRVVQEFGSEKFCQQIAAVAIDGFTHNHLEVADFVKTYRQDVLKYGLSYIFQLSRKEEIQSAADASNSFIYLDTEVNESLLDLTTPVLVEIDSLQDSKPEISLQFSHGIIVNSGDTANFSPEFLSSIVKRVAAKD
jgi:hypothetical protein